MKKKLVVAILIINLASFCVNAKMADTPVVVEDNKAQENNVKEDAKQTDTITVTKNIDLPQENSAEETIKNNVNQVNTNIKSAQTEIDNWLSDFNERCKESKKEHEDWLKKFKREQKKVSIENTDDTNGNSSVSDYIRDIRVQSLNSSIKDIQSSLNKNKRGIVNAQRKMKKELARQKRYTKIMNRFKKIPECGEDNWLYYISVKNHLDSSRSECIDLQEKIEDEFEKQQEFMEELQDKRNELKDWTNS